MGRRAQQIASPLLGLVIAWMCLPQSDAQETAQNAVEGGPGPSSSEAEALEARLASYGLSTLGWGEGELPRVHGPRRFEFDVSAGDAAFEFSLSQITPEDFASGTLNSASRFSWGGSDDSALGSRSSVYLFVASDNEAIAWRPRVRNEFGRDTGDFALREQVEIGDASVGLGYERNGVQASLAYVERTEQTNVGVQSFSQDTSFVGITITRR